MCACVTRARNGWYKFKISMRESFIEARAGREIKKLGGIPIKLLSTLFTGLPDRLFILPKGLIFFREFKAPNKTQSPIQKLVMKKLEGLGCDVGVIDNMESLEEFLEHVKQKMK